MYADAMTTPQLLRTVLLLNAGFSLASGTLLTIAPDAVATALGADIDGWLRLLGVALVGHAALLLFGATRPDTSGWGKLNLVAIAPYPVAMVAAALVVEPTTGVVLVLADGAIIGALAVANWMGLRHVAVPSTA